MHPIILVNTKSSSYSIKTTRTMLENFAAHHNATIKLIPDTFFTDIKIKEQNIIIAGGDGTFQTALNHKPFHKKNLGFFPLGAGNAVHTALQEKPLHLLQGTLTQKKIDVLTVTWDNNSLDTLLFSAGTDALIMKNTTRTKLPRSVDYARAIATTKHSSSWQATWTIDTIQHKGSFTNILLAKIPHYGYSLKAIPGKVPMADGTIYGLLSDHTLQPLNRMLQLLVLNFGMTKKGFFCCKKFTLTGEPFPIQGAGEYLGTTTNVKIQIKRQQSILVPTK